MLIAGLLLSPIGSLLCFRHTLLAAYADHYGVEGAQSDWLLFLSLTIICMVAFVVCAGGIIASLVKSRHTR